MNHAIEYKIDEHGHLVIAANPEYVTEIREQLADAEKSQSDYYGIMNRLNRVGDQHSPYIRHLKRKAERIKRDDLPGVVLNRLESDVLDGMTSGAFSLVNPEDIGALTEATILCDGSYDDDGEVKADHFWSDIEFYQIESFVVALARDGSVTFRKAD